jgi:hypothetical protein
LIGTRGDSAATAKLLRGTVISSDESMIRNYLINQAMKYRDEAMAMSLPDVIDDVVPKAIATATKEHINLRPITSLESKIHKSQFLDFLDDQFYESMANAVRRRFPEEYNLANQKRIENLGKALERFDSQIAEYEGKRSISKDKKDRQYYEDRINELQQLKAEFEERLRGLS